MLLHGWVGAVVGYLLLHPLSMLVYWVYEGRGGGVLEAAAMAFALHHVPMAMYFACLGLVAGAMHGVYMYRLKTLYRRVRALSVTDGLTGLHNRAHLFELLDAEVARCRRYGRPLCLLMVDIDHFKQFNDSHGHQAGDRLLRAFAEAMLAAVRRTDIVGRYGGEEFLVAMPETRLEVGVEVARRLCTLIALNPFAGAGGEGARSVTCSIGFAALPVAGGELDALVAQADAALYEAKGSGRNQVCVARSGQSVCAPASGGE